MNSTFSHQAKNIAWFILVVLLLASCVEEYWPELGSSNEDLLVVDGMITNLPGPYEIKLSRVTDVTFPKYEPVLNSLVMISDDLGEEEILFEYGDGRYLTSGITGKVGRSYKLSILTADNKVYESDYELMHMPTGIDSIYPVVEDQPHPELDRPILGYRFHINTAMAVSDSNYYLWRMESTYKFNSILQIRYWYDGQMHQFSPYDSLFTCWKTKNIPEIFTYNTLNLSEPRITGFPLHFVSTDTRELSIRYSLLVSQMSISNDAFQFWDKLKELNVEAGSLFSKQPFQVRGNMHNVKNPDEPVLGYFMAAGVSQKRIFVDKPSDIEFFYPDECNLITEDLGTMLELLHDQWPLYLAGMATENGFSIGLPVNQSCVDCRKNGGNLQPPDFWEE